MALSERPTADLVMLIITLLIALSILLTGAGVFLLALFHPEYNMQAVLSAFAEVIGLMIGAVLGYLAGKGRSSQSKETV